MSGIVSSISNAIESATYNPEFAKKKEEEQKKIKDAVGKYKKDLEGYTKELDSPLKMPGSGPGSAPRTDYYVRKLSELLASEKKYVDGDPSSPEEVEKRRSETRETMDELRKANQSVSMLTWYPSLVNGLEKDAKAKGIKMPKEDTNRLNEVKTKSETFLKGILKESPRDIIEKQIEIDDILNNKIKSDLPPVRSKEELDKLEKTLEESEKAEASVFSLRRMIGTITNTAMNTITILFLVMLFLVGGMLAANAAIGRPYPYRILYFIYGGLGSPLVILYYLYQWFFGTPPKIYTLLPIFTSVSDTSLGRMFFFPFTYTPDQNEETLRMDYLRDAAAIVKKSVETIRASAPPPDPPTIYDQIRNAAVAQAAPQQLNSVLRKLQTLQVGTEAKLQGILEALEEVRLQQNNSLPQDILKKLESISLPAAPLPSAPPPNIPLPSAPPPNNSQSTNTYEALSTWGKGN